MKLNYKEIPPKFLTSIPEGIKFVRKHGNDYLVVEKLFCQNEHNLIADTVHIHNEPALYLHIDIGRSGGLVFVDAFWGGHSKLYSFIPDLNSSGPKVKALCPICKVSLIVKDKCTFKDCKSDEAILFYLPGKKNKIYICAKIDCPGHRMDIVDLPVNITEEVSHINYFGSQADDILMEI